MSCKLCRLRHLSVCALHILPMVPRCLRPFPSFPGTNTSTSTHQQPAIHHPWLPSQLCGLRHLFVRCPKHLPMVPWCHGTHPPAIPNSSACTQSHPKPTIYGAGMPGKLQGLRHMSLRSRKHLPVLPRVHLANPGTSTSPHGTHPEPTLENSRLPTRIRGLRHLPVRHAGHLSVLPGCPWPTSPGKRGDRL